MRIGWEQAAAWRLDRQHLHRRARAGDLVAVVARLCGLHAQLTSGAELALWARIEDLEPGALAAALWHSRSLVKLWAMRGTLHLLPARELGLWLAALGTYRDYRSTEPEMVELAEAIGAALSGRLLGRDELAEQVRRRTGSAALARLVHGGWGTHLKPASFQGRLCFGPGEGARVRFTAPATWLGGGLEPVDPDRALTEVARRYLGAYGPAGAADLARWWGVGPARAARMIAALGDEVLAVEVDGAPCWILAAHADQLACAAPRPAVRLLPAFDQWVVCAGRDVPALLDPALRDRVYRPQGWISPVLLVDGRIRGVWSLDRTGRRVTVTVSPFRRLPARARARCEVEAARLAAFLGGGLDLRWGG